MKNSFKLSALTFALATIAGCSQPAQMGSAVHEMAAAQVATDVPADSLGGSMAGIGDRVGKAYRGHVDSPQEVKDSMGVSFIRTK